MADTTNAATMHPDFPRWYREVSVEENRDRIARRWIGVSKLVADMKTNDAEALLRVVYRAKARPSADSLTRIRKIFKDADDLFDVQGNDREIEVLGGAALAVLLESDGRIVAEIALAITTTVLEGTRVAHLPMDLGALAETSIARIAESQRTRPTRAKLTLKKAKDALAQFDAAGVSSAFDRAAEAINSAFASSDKFIAIQDEELDMLWWVLNERSDDLAGCGKTRLEADAVPRNSLVSTAQPDKKEVCAEKTNSSWMSSAMLARSSECRTTILCVRCAP
jgi:hypothetical protein